MQVTHRQKALAGGFILALVVGALLATALTGSNASCNDDEQTYYSRVLNASFCYPDSWDLHHGDDEPLLPVHERFPGYQAWIQLVRPSTPFPPFSAALAIRYAGETDPLARTTLWNCAAPETLPIDGRSAKVCVMENPGPGQISSMPPETLRLIGVEIEGDPLIVVSIELYRVDSTRDGITASHVEAEAMGIVSSIRKGERR